MMATKFAAYALAFGTILTLSNAPLTAQSTTEIFGKNRIQTKKIEWKFYDSKQFRIYHYERSGRELARYVAEQIDQDLAAIEKRMSGVFPKMVDVVLYNSYDDYDQSNIGLKVEKDLQSAGALGSFTLLGDQLKLYFDGNHNNLKKQIRHGMARIMVERMMYGETFAEQVKDMVALDLPDWFLDGYLSYLIEGWTTNDDNAWRNLVDYHDPAIYFYEIAKINPHLAGKAFWKFMAVQYGEAEMKNLLTITKSKSNLNKAIRMSTGKDTKPFFLEMMAFYNARYQAENPKLQPIDSQNFLGSIPASTQDVTIRNVMISPNGDQIAYVRYEHGEYQIIIEKTNLGDEQRKPAVILRMGNLNHGEPIDPNYPMIAWSNTGFKLGIIYRKDKYNRIRVYDASRGKIQNFRIPANRFDRITGFAFMEDDDMLLMSAVRRGQSDLFEYRMKGGRMNQITDDAWDDENPVFVSGGSRKGVVFLSNRPEPFINIKPLPNELPSGNRKAYFYNSTTKSYNLLNISQGFSGDIQNIIPYGMDNFAFLSDKNGIRNRYVVIFEADKNNMDSAYSIPTTNYERSIIAQQYNPASKKIGDVIQHKDRLNIYFRPAELPAPWGNLEATTVETIDFIDDVKSELKGKNRLDQALNNDTKQDEEFVIKVGNDFQTPFVTEEVLKTVNPIRQESFDFAAKLDNTSTAPAEQSKLMYDEQGKRIMYVDSTYIDLRSSVLKPVFKISDVGFKLDNSLLFSKYQSYTTMGGSFNNAGLSPMFFANLYEKMNDHRIFGGVRLPSNGNKFTYMFGYENFKRRTDWGVTFFTQPTNLEFNLTQGALQYVVKGTSSTKYLQAHVIYPFTKTMSARFYQGFRFDRLAMRASDYNSLSLPNINDFWSTSRAELVYDDTDFPIYNIRRGLRLKLYGEYFYKLTAGSDQYVFENVNYTGKGGMFNVGLDVRYYKPIWKRVTLATRIAAGTSMGDYQMLYALGGVENGLNSKYDNKLKPSGENNYAFQTIATSVRGYDQNVRNGNTFIMANIEVRVPIMHTFFNKESQSSFLKHLQFVPFVDVGNAWEGLFPTEGNGLRYGRYVWPAPPSSPTIAVNIDSKLDSGPLVGYGLGLRTRVFGYFIKVDGARNILGDYNWHLSLGLDF